MAILFDYLSLYVYSPSSHTYAAVLRCKSIICLRWQYWTHSDVVRPCVDLGESVPG